MYGKESTKTSRTPLTITGRFEKNAKGELTLVFNPIADTDIAKRVYVSEPRVNEKGEQVSKGGNVCLPLQFAPLQHPTEGEICWQGARGAITVILAGVK